MRELGVRRRSRDTFGLWQILKCLATVSRLACADRRTYTGLYDVWSITSRIVSADVRRRCYAAAIVLMALTARRPRFSERRPYDYDITLAEYTMRYANSLFPFRLLEPLASCTVYIYIRGFAQCLFVCLGFNGTFSTNRLYRAITVG